MATLGFPSQFRGNKLRPTTMVQNDGAAWASARRRKRAALTPLASPWAAFHIGTGGQACDSGADEQDKLLDPWRQLSSASVSHGRLPGDAL
jgi:hypothetical protein